MTHDPAIREAAIDWVIRQRDPAFADWEAFADWLGTSEANAHAYHEAVALDDALGVTLAALPATQETTTAPAGAPALPPVALPAAQPDGRWSRRRVWMSGAMAAAIVAIIGVTTLRPATSRISTMPGEQRELILSDGSRIALNGSTTLLVSRTNERQLVLEQGQALFTVVHRADAPFSVSVGNNRLVNIGTVFDVVRSDGRMDVAVSEGAVAFNPDSNAIRIDAGEALTADEASGQVIVAAVDTASVGSWQHRQLIYDGAPLARVAADVSRTTGVRIRAAPEVANLPFRGALTLSGGAATVAADLAALSGTRAVADGEGWTLAQ